MGKLILFFIGIIALIGVLSSGGGSTATAQSSIPNAQRLGYEGHIRLAQGSWVPLAATVAIRSEIEKAQAANDQMGFSALLLSNRAVKASNGDAILVIDSNGPLTKVRVTSGDNLGASGWLPREWVQ